MFAEIYAMIDALLSPLNLNVPRRKLCAFGAVLSNSMLVRFAPCWDVNDSKKGCENRVVNVYDSDTGLVDRDIETTAKSLGLTIDELVHYWPDKLTFWVNPNSVVYRIGNGQKAACLFPHASGPLAQQHSNVPPAPLILVQQSPTMMITNVGAMPSQFLLPYFVSNAFPKDQTYTVGDFAMTRFGASRARKVVDTNDPNQQQQASLCCTSFCQPAFIECRQPPSVVPDGTETFMNEMAVAPMVVYKSAPHYPHHNRYNEPMLADGMAGGDMPTNHHYKHHQYNHRPRRHESKRGHHQSSMPPAFLSAGGDNLG